MKNIIKALDFLSGCSLNESYEGIITIGIDELSGLLVAYASQIRPESVSIVLPSEDVSEPFTQYWIGVKDGYNACIAEIKRLNKTTLPDAGQGKKE